MSAKPKSSGKKDSAEPYVGLNKDPELEKKVDALLSLEEPVPEPEAPPAPEPVIAPPKINKKITITHMDDATTEPAPVAPASTPAIGSAPLLPSDKLPDLNKKKPEEDPPLEAFEIPDEPPAEDAD